MKRLLAVLMLASCVAMAQDLPQVYAPLFGDQPGLARMDCSEYIGGETPAFPDVECWSVPVPPALLVAEIDRNTAELEAQFEWRQAWQRTDDFYLRHFDWGGETHRVAVGPDGALFSLVIARPDP